MTAPSGQYLPPGRAWPIPAAVWALTGLAFGPLARGLSAGGQMAAAGVAIGAVAAVLNLAVWGCGAQLYHEAL